MKQLTGALVVLSVVACGGETTGPAPPPPPPEPDYNISGGWIGSADMSGDDIATFGLDVNDDSGLLSGLATVSALIDDDIIGLDCDVAGVRNDADVNLRLEECHEGGQAYEDIRYDATVEVDQATLTADAIDGRVTGSGFFLNDLKLRREN